MTNKTEKNHKRKKTFWISLMALILCMGMMIGTTLAWFTDTAVSGSNKIQAGNLDVEVTHVNAAVTTAESIEDASKLWSRDANGDDMLWEPGVVSYETFTVKNAGNLALTYKLLMNQLATSDYNTVVSNDSSDGKSLKDVLYVHAVSGAASVTRPTTKMSSDDKTIAELLASDAEILSGNLEDGSSSDALTVYIYWPADDGNDCNLQNGKYASDATAETVGSLWINLSVTASATQYAFEYDSFDNQYDANAGGDSSDDDNNPYLTFSSDAEFTLGVSDYSYAVWSGTIKLESSTNGTDWVDFKGIQDGDNYVDPSVTAVQNAKDGKYYVYLRGTGSLVGTDFSYQYTTLTITDYTALVDCSGNIMTLLNYSDPDSAVLTSHSFFHLFDGCIALKSAPTLPATTLAVDCYCAMFKGCSSLMKAPDLPATKLENDCYACMFSGCSALETAPKISATELADNCYREMFSDCTSLTSVQEVLYGDDAKEQSFCYMFAGCTSLTKAPVLPATTLEYYCYYHMFDGCTSLSVVECEATDADKFMTLPDTIPVIRNESAVDGMFANTPTASTIGTDGTPSAGKSYKIDTSTPSPAASYLCFTANTAGSTVTPNFVSGSYQYSTDNGTSWTDGTNDGTTTINLTNVGDRVLLKGTDCVTSDTSQSGYNHFEMTGSIAASGDVTSLTNGVGGDATLTEACYSNMFNGCPITSAPALPSTVMANNCYESMFYNCTVLSSAPALPSTALAENCYKQMFKGCTWLFETPELPATELASGCYSEMFAESGIIKITALPDNLTYKNQCMYAMFNGCSNLKVQAGGEIPSGGGKIFTCYTDNINSEVYMMFSCTGGDLNQSDESPSNGNTYYYVSVNVYRLGIVLENCKLSDPLVPIRYAVTSESTVSDVDLKKEDGLIFPENAVVTENSGVIATLTKSTVPMASLKKNEIKLSIDVSGISSDATITVTCTQ